MRPVYENVEIIRERRGIKKKKMAEDAGISAMAYSRISSGETKCDTALLASFARTLLIDDYNVFF